MINNLYNIDCKYNKFIVNDWCEYNAKQFADSLVPQIVHNCKFSFFSQRGNYPLKRTLINNYKFPYILDDYRENSAIARERSYNIVVDIFSAKEKLK